MTAIGVSPDGRVATIAESTPLEQLSPGPLPDQVILAGFDERVTRLATRIRERADHLGDIDLATQDLFIEILRGLEKQRWMIRAHRS